jgi:predicted ATP-grasp superfamily ATP-dependent carboligase
MARILVLDGHSSAGLAFTRSLGRAGHWVAVGSNRGAFAPAALSRYCKQAIEYPVSTADPLGFIEFIEQFVRQNGIELVLPMTDWTMFPLVRWQDKFRGLAHLAVPSSESLAIVSDKYNTITLARELNIPVPETVMVSSLDDLDATREWNFPLVVKDRFSVRWLADKSVFGVTSYAYSRADLLAQAKQRLEQAGDVLVQQFVKGVGVGFSCFALDNKAHLPFEWERVREIDPRGGGSSTRKSVALDTTVLEMGRNLTLRSKFQGIAMVEFKRDPAARQLRLMEINGRPWGSMQLAVESGVDYPRYVAAWYLQGVNPPEHAAYKKNITCRRFVADLNHLAQVRRGKPAQWPGDFPNFWPTLMRVSVPWYPGLRYEDLKLSDIHPGLAELWRWFRIRLGRDQTLIASSKPVSTVKGIVHCHTTRSYDGELPVDELSNLLRSQGFGFVALTEHPLGLKAGEFEEYVRKCREVSDDKFVAIPGLEFRCLDGTEIAGIGISEWLEAETPDQIVARIRALGGFALWVHPWKRRRSTEPFLECDAVEVMNTKLDGSLAPNLSLLRRTGKERKAGKHFYAMFGIDFHNRTQPFSAWIECQVSELTPAAIVESFREGRFVSRVPYAAMSSAGRAGVIGYSQMVLFRCAYLVWKWILKRVPGSARTAIVAISRPALRRIRPQSDRRPKS